MTGAAPSPTPARGGGGPDEPLSVSNLTTAFATTRGEITAVEDVRQPRYRRDPGHVGESGSGKSVTALTIMGLLPQPPARVAAGEVRFAGEVLTKLSTRACSASAAGHRDGVPGADDLAQPGVHHRRAGHGNHPRA